MANPIASPGLGQAVNVTGTFAVFTGPPVCTLSMSGTVTTVGTATIPGVVTFTSGSTSGPPGCVSSGFTTAVLTTTSMTQLVITGGPIVPTPIGAGAIFSYGTETYNNVTGVITSSSFLYPGTFQTVSSQLVIG